MRLRRRVPKLEATRVRLFPQAPFLARYREPETVRLSVPAGSVGAGPEDASMYAIRPIGKPGPYGLLPTLPPTVLLPPWDGRIGMPAVPSPQGHFDHLLPGTDPFILAHAYGCARFVLDVWEAYLGERVRWHFRSEVPRLEISDFPFFANARAGWGFLELGAEPHADGSSDPYALNFDIVAHEMGHLIIYSVVGVPDPEDDTSDYYGFHESAADVVALLAAAHFASVVDEVFEQTRGNLYAINRLSSFGEITSSTQIRIASNGVSLETFALGWTDEHDLSLPLTGMTFDIIVDIFHECLKERGLISGAAEDLADRLEYVPERADELQDLFDRDYARQALGFHEAFADARDIIGTYLAYAWTWLASRPLTYAGVARALLRVDRELNRGRYARIIRNNALLRGIGLVEVGPRLAPASPDSHGCSVRVMVPERSLPRLPPGLRRQGKWLGSS